MVELGFAIIRSLELPEVVKSNFTIIEFCYIMGTC